MLGGRNWHKKHEKSEQIRDHKQNACETLEARVTYSFFIITNAELHERKNILKKRNRNYTRPCILLFIFPSLDPTIFILKLWYIKEHLFVPIVAKIGHLNCVIQVGKLHIQSDLKRADVGYKVQLLCACISLDVLLRNYKRQLVMSNKWPKTDRDCDFLMSPSILLPGYM